MRIIYYIIIALVLILYSCSDEGVNPIYGCTDFMYAEYNPNANIDDGSCSQENPDLLFYEPDILYLFSSSGCLGCHTGTSSGGLDLSTYIGTINGGNNGSIINFDTPSESILWTTFDNGGVMCDNIGMCGLYLPNYNAIFTWIAQGALEN